MTVIFCGFDIIGWKLRVGGWQQNVVVFHGNYYLY
jgi:hypothetical protein